MEKLICETALEKSGIKSPELNFLNEAAKKAASIGGNILMKYYGHLSSIENKGRSGDLLTNADVEAETEIINFLKTTTPEIGIFAEESGGQNLKGDLVWCIDPLDGTTNFAHGYPFFATSVGLTFQDIPLLGAINVPFLKENYWACPNFGSYCNEKQITVSSTNSLTDSLLVTGFAYDRQSTPDNNYAEFCWLTHRTRGVRRGGAAAVDLAFVANGRIDAYWERGLSKWDLAAGVPIVELAGGIVTDYKSEEFNLNNGRIVASNRLIDKELINELKKVIPLEEKSYGIETNNGIRDNLKKSEAN